MLHLRFISGPVPRCPPASSVQTSRKREPCKEKATERDKTVPSLLSDVNREPPIQVGTDEWSEVILDLSEYQTEKE